MNSMNPSKGNSRHVYVCSYYQKIIRSFKISAIWTSLGSLSLHHSRKMTIFHGTFLFPSFYQGLSQTRTASTGRGYAEPNRSAKLLMLLSIANMRHCFLCIIFYLAACKKDVWLIVLFCDRSYVQKQYIERYILEVSIYTGIICLQASRHENRI